MTAQSSSLSYFPEALSIIVAAALVWLSALVQHFSNVAERGTGYVLSDRAVPPPVDGFFGRATRTLQNNMEAGMMWVPPAAALIIFHQTSLLSQYISATFICARIVFTLSYWFGIRVIRSFAWLSGMICCAAIALLAIGAAA